MKQKKQISFKVKLIGLSVGLFALLGISSFLMMNQLIHLQEASKADSFEAFAQNVNNAIAAQFYERYDDIQTFAIDPALMAKDHREAVGALNTFAATHGIYELILVVDRSGHLIATNDKSTEGKPLKTEFLYQKNFSDAPWFKSVMAGKFTEDEGKGFRGTYFEDVHVDPDATGVYGSKQLVTGFSAPVKDEQGNVRAVITARTSSRWFETAFQEAYAMLKDQDLGSSQLMLLNKEGTLVYEFSKKTAEAKTEEGKYDWSRILQANPAKNGNVAAQDVQKRTSGSTFQENVFTHQMDLTGYAPVESPKFISSIGWSVLIQDEVQEAFGKTMTAKRTFYFTFGLLFLFGGIVAFWYSNRISARLLSLAGLLAANGEKVAGVAGQISESSMVLSEASMKQAAAIQETAASIDEVSAMVKKNSENAVQSQNSSQRSRESAEYGQIAVQKMIQSISDISESNQQIMNQVMTGNQKISEIVNMISEIENKTKIINDIVFQTNLLSFNASIEAARAGEHGKGFAVVAEEIGNLAKISGNAAKEISDLLGNSIQKVEVIVSETKISVERLMTEGRNKLDSGKTTANECGEILSQILTGAQDVDRMVSEIAVASQEQSQGVEEINKAMNQVDTVTQRNSAISQESAAYAQELNRQSIDLKQAVGELSFLITGNAQDGVRTGTSVVKSAVVEENHSAEVIPFKRKKKVSTKTAKVTPKEKVVSTKNAAQEYRSEPKIAVGLESSIPMHDDPRFEDV